MEKEKYIYLSECRQKFQSMEKAEGLEFSLLSFKIKMLLDFRGGRELKMCPHIAGHNPGAFLKAKPGGKSSSDQEETLRLSA